MVVALRASFKFGPDIHIVPCWVSSINALSVRRRSWLRIVSRIRVNGLTVVHRRRGVRRTAGIDIDHGAADVDAVRSEFDEAGAGFDMHLHVSSEKDFSRFITKLLGAVDMVSTVVGNLLLIVS